VTNDDMRSVPNSGEIWEFSNGIIATIMGAGRDGVTDLDQVDPTDYKTAFKFNAVNDPMPVRRVNI